MEGLNSRSRSQAWDHFDLRCPSRVRCLICSQELKYAGNTSSMLRHLRAKHPNFSTSAEVSQPGKQEETNNALVNMIVKDVRPISVVEDEGFRAFVNKLDPAYTLPSKKALKNMVIAKCPDTVKEQETIKEEEEADTSSVQSVGEDLGKTEETLVAQSQEEGPSTSTTQPSALPVNELFKVQLEKQIKKCDLQIEHITLLKRKTALELELLEHQLKAIKKT